MCKKLNAFVLIVLFALTACSIGPKKKIIPDADSDFATVFGIEDGYVIKESDGGMVIDFEHAAKEIRAMGREVRVDGVCSSACVIFADQARPYVCITSRAEFGFHMVHDFDTKEPTGPMEMSKDIDDWVLSHGGYPPQQLLPMPFEDAKAFWPVCK